MTTHEQTRKKPNDCQKVQKCPQNDENIVWTNFDIFEENFPFIEFFECDSLTQQYETLYVDNVLATDQ